jgi:hypothetical protein
MALFENGALIPSNSAIEASQRPWTIFATFVLRRVRREWQRAVT